MRKRNEHMRLSVNAKEKKKRIDGDEMKRIRYIEVRIKFLLLSHFRERFKIKLI